MTTPQDPNGPQQQPYIPAPPPLSESELRGGGGSAPALPAPKEVQISFWIWIASAVISIVGVLFALTQREVIESSVRASPDADKLSPEAFDAAVTAAMLFAVVFGVVIAGLYVLFAFKARAGKNWARVVLTVLTALGVLMMLFGTTVVAMFSTLISVVAVVLLYLPNSKAYFDSVKRVG